MKNGYRYCTDVAPEATDLQGMNNADGGSRLKCQSTSVTNQHDNAVARNARL